ncbi:MAG: glutamine synthetase type III [Myxococcales bacterium]|nr:glutamine synthetase type III [Myxococcales bacterium]
MSNQARTDAVQKAASRTIRTFARPMDTQGRPVRVSALLGAHTFNADRMRERVPPEFFARWQETIEHGRKLDRPVADAIAHAVKEWALENGVSHFCHWFHPMTGSTAEKHDAFLWFDREGRPVEKFTGSMLLQSEPDASSFPSGGMRSTFEARGYTAWDPTSPMFIMDSANGRTLCIPSAFLGYHGQALDEKAPLLRSMETISRSAVRLLGLLGETAHRITVTVGPEQEYFLIDRAYAGLRSDLVIAGRSLLGARAPKGQMLEDHYFGSIPVRVHAFMEEVELELYQLGVSAKTRHNEVAPCQFELAPIFVEANLAADHNQLVMQTLRRVALRHDFLLLLHEKPFAFVNGSGKHINWSLQDTRGENLLDPGKNPQENLRFLTFLAATLLGVYRHASILRASIASHGNDFRLGANEAPPAIISVFLGDFLTRICDGIASGDVSILDPGQAMIELGISRLPAIAKDNTDRNRTSPFAFTGNKFEFRAVGASASISFPTTCLNAAVADGIDQVHAWATADGGTIAAVMAAVRRALVESAPVRFDGNGYGAEWVVEAERRGLPHARNTPAALRALATDAAAELFKRQGVFSPEELHSRFEVRVEQYNKKVEIEADVLRDLVDTVVLPVSIAELADASAHSSTGPAAARRYLDLRARVEVLDEARLAIESAWERVGEGSEADRATALCAHVVPALAALREACDSVEAIVSDSRWPLPRYREMLFLS